MAGSTGMVREASALLDPEPESRSGYRALSDDRAQADLEDVYAGHRIGRILLQHAARTGRVQAAAAAVEVFRGVLDRAANVSWLRNGAGAALVERARLESAGNALATLHEALQEFRAASAAAISDDAPRAVCLRYEINAAMALWMLAERTGEPAGASEAVALLRTAAAELGAASAHWSQVQDNLGNALMTLGQISEAIIAYQAALDGRQTLVERGRSLNNLGTAYAEQGRYAEARKNYRAALALQPRDRMPLAWARVQHNLGSVLLQAALASKRPPLMAKEFTRAIEALEAAGQERLPTRSPLDWAVTTVNLAGAYVGLGTHLAPADAVGAAGHIRHAIGLYQAALPELAPSDQAKTVANAGIALRILAKIAGDAATAAAIRAQRTDLLAFATKHGLTAAVEAIESDLAGGPGGVTVASPPGMPQEIPAHDRTGGLRTGGLRAGLAWPTETYSEASRAHKENIVDFLRRVWLPLIKAGMVDLRTLRARDPSAAKGIDNFTQKRDAATGERRRLPADLDVPTKKQLNDRLAETFPDPGDRPVRLDWALRSRARRAAIRK